MSEPNAVEVHLPLHPRVLLVLSALLEGPLHGAALLDRVEELSSGTLRPGPATLYRTLDRLEADGLIRAVDADPDGSPGRPGRPYEPTGLGRRVTGAEFRRLSALRSEVAPADPGDGR